MQKYCSLIENYVEMFSKLYFTKLSLLLFEIMVKLQLLPIVICKIEVSRQHGQAVSDKANEQIL